MSLKINNSTIRSGAQLNAIAMTANGGSRVGLLSAVFPHQCQRKLFTNPTHDNFVNATNQ
jgi:hypothetical protein